MSPSGIRRALHHAYTLATLVLLVTGALLAWPDLRALAVGGYGREIWQLHLWAGWAFLAVPVLAVGAAARPLLRDFRRRLGPPDGVTWRKVHTIATLAAGILLGLSGLLLWLDAGLPIAVIDAALAVHQALSWFVVAALLAHLVAARRKIAVRTGEILGRDSELLFPLESEDDLEDR
jgi:cytochrome b subunit of formate dehydrogenase